MFDGQNADDCFNGTGSPQKMAGHGFGGVNHYVVGMFAKNVFNGLGLVFIVQAGRCAMRIDVINIIGRNTCIINGFLHAAGCQFSAGTGSGNVISIAVGAVTDDFCINMGASLLCVFQFFQNEHAAAFTKDKAVSSYIKGAGRFFRRAFSGGKGFHGSKSCHRSLGYSSFSTAGKHDIRITILDGSGSTADGIISGSAGSHISQYRSHKTEVDGNLAGSHIGNHHGNSKGIHLGRSSGVNAMYRLFHGIDAADAGTNNGTYAVRVFNAHVQFGIFHCHFSSCHSKLHIPVHMADCFSVSHIFHSIKVLDFAGDAHRESFRIKFRNRADAGFAGHQRIPKFFCTDTYGRNYAHTCYNDSSFFH